ncbi:MAG: TIGR04076 family protein [Candidatus Heimdallarchaeaceae archaeon]
MSKKVILEVVSQKGHCAAGHQVGDEISFDFDTNEISGKICLHALYSVLPKIFAMAYGADFPWLEDKDLSTHACPDAYNPVVFQVKREK